MVGYELLKSEIYTNGDQSCYICKICGEVISAKSNMGLGKSIPNHYLHSHALSSKNIYDTYYKTASERTECSNCGVTVDFYSLFKGYGLTCSRSCASVNRAKEGWYGKNSVENRIQRAKILEARNKTDKQRDIVSGTMRVKVNKLWKTPEFKLLRSKSSSESLLWQWQNNSDYRDSALAALKGTIKYNSGEFVSYRLGKIFVFRSSFEFKMFNILEDSKLYYNSESYFIKYQLDDQIWRTYIPDLYVEYDSVKFIIEIKPFDKLSDVINVTKFEYARKFCLKHRLVFCIITEYDIFNPDFDIYRYLTQMFNDYRKSILNLRV